MRLVKQLNLCTIESLMSNLLDKINFPSDLKIDKKFKASFRRIEKRTYRCSFGNW